ncbi:FAD-binding oxidoreductase [Microbacterium sp. A204]|uniref:FAD-binding oxidoreductase n=1 Tax=Microbacterium sp. A204 TaxID=3457321 RepID=UPI003FCFA6E3
MTDETRATGSTTAEPFAARPTTAVEVADLVRHAKESGLRLTVVAGGHGPWARTPAPGMRIELEVLSHIDVDDAVVHIGGGAVWGDVAAALDAHGLAISSGDTGSVGVGGLTLGGGIGWMVRAWGIAADQLIGAQIVTAAGDIVEASAAENPDLFWAIRGGGGNFGIVTRFDFQAHRIAGITLGEHTVTDTAPALRALRDLMRDAPRELTVTYIDVPPMDPSAPAGARLTAVWAGVDPDRLRSVMGPVSHVAGVEADYSTPAYREILLGPSEPSEGADTLPAFIGGNGLFADLDDELIDRLIDFRSTHPASVVLLRSLGGAYSDVVQESTPFPARSANWFVMAGGFDVPGLVDDATRERISADWGRIQERRIAEYGNFAVTERTEAVPGMFTESALARLREIKAKWDPENLFRRNHNIEV